MPAIKDIVFANLITLSRAVLLLLVLWLLACRTPVQSCLALILIILVFYLDVLDGRVARTLGQESDTGGMLDTLVDRVVENGLWFWFSHQGLVPIIVPVVVLVRGLMTDAFRALALSRMHLNSMADTPDRMDWLVSSRFMRGIYGTFKLLTFAGLTLLAIGTQARDSGLADYGFAHTEIRAAIDLLIAVTVFLCLLRALPAVRNGYRFVSEWAEWPERRDMLN